MPIIKGLSPAGLVTLSTSLSVPLQIPMTRANLSAWYQRIDKISILRFIKGYQNILSCEPLEGSTKAVVKCGRCRPRDKEPERDKNIFLQNGL